MSTPEPEGHPFALHAASAARQQEGEALPPAVVGQAADWMARLQSEAATAADARDCQAWRAADPRHELAWQRLAALDHDLQRSLPHDGWSPVSAAVARETLRELVRRQARRKFNGWTLGLTGAAVSAWMLRGHTPWPRLAADLQTATGETRAVVLDDGTRLHLSSAAAVDLRFTPRERRILLHAGEILVDSGHDPAGRPLQVVTTEGTATPLGTQFTVSRHGAAVTQVSVLAGHVRLQPREAGLPLMLQPGQQAGFDRYRVVQPPAPVLPGTGAWAEGMLVAERQRLDAFLAELAHWRRGVLRCDPAVGPLRVTGSFPLADTDRVLSMLAHILPVRVVYRSRWWVTVAPA
ncbi:FecR family protein [Pseudorhodoferax sp.]|uniref:FecR family protein n=1 Tax=Pseudorhodoferax sp. TaxID=1993553 RepID=UPI0039E2C2F2